jgi:hypothetical protein
MEEYKEAKMNDVTGSVGEAMQDFSTPELLQHRAELSLRTETGFVGSELNEQERSR